MRLVKGLLQRCVEVVEFMAASAQPCRLSDIAAALDLPKSAAHRLLRELQALRWVEQRGSEGPYRLTVRFALLGRRVLDASGLPGLAQPLLDDLAVCTHELVRLTLPTGTGLAWFATAQGAPPGLVYSPGLDHPIRLFATANGKAWLATFDDAAALDQARRDGLGRIRPTRRSHTTEASLLADLRRIRRRGYALADEEAEKGVCAVAVVVGADERKAFGTLSVAGPSIRVADRIAAFAVELKRSAAELAAIWPTEVRPTNVRPTDVPHEAISA